MCEPRKLSAEILETWVFGTADATKDVARWMARRAVRPFSDERLERARWVLTWRFAIELVVAALVVWRFGEAAMWIFAGGAAVSWVLAHGMRRELARRAAMPEPEVEEEPERPNLRAVS